MFRISFERGNSSPEIGPQPTEGMPQPNGVIPPEQMNPEQAEVNPVLIIPKELAAEIKPTILYITQKPLKEFQIKRAGDPIAALLNPERLKTQREEEEIDRLVNETITSGAASNREEAMGVLYEEHLYAPENLRNLLELTRGLDQGKAIDMAFLEELLHNRRVHEDGVANGQRPHWNRETPPTKKERMRAEKERDKMDKFLTTLSELRRSQ